MGEDEVQRSRDEEKEKTTLDSIINHNKMTSHLKMNTKKKTER
jgi:hypothetical protein